MKIVQRLLIILLIGAFLFACGKKEGGVEGKVIDGQGQPLSGVTVIFNSAQPMPGATQPQVRTDTDGAFNITGLTPAAEYIITLESDSWTSMITKKIIAPGGRGSLTLDKPIVIRFQLLKDGTVLDSKTGLQWLIYTATDISAENVTSTVKSIRTGGFNDWRLPTKSEIMGLKDPTTAVDKEGPQISPQACCVWTSELNSDQVEWDFYLDDGSDIWKSSKMPANDRIVVIRTYGAASTEQAATIVVPSPATTPASQPATPATTVAATQPSSENKLQDAGTVTIHFEPNKSTIIKEDLDKLKGFFTKVKDTAGSIIIEGHSNLTNSKIAATKDSVDIALNTMAMLQKMGITDKINVEVRGVGSIKPVADNNTPEGKVKNRRVELTFNAG